MAVELRLDEDQERHAELFEAGGHVHDVLAVNALDSLLVRDPEVGDTGSEGCQRGRDQPLTLLESRWSARIGRQGDPYSGSMQSYFWPSRCCITGKCSSQKCP